MRLGSMPEEPPGMTDDKIRQTPERHRYYAGKEEVIATER